MSSSAKVEQLHVADSTPPAHGWYPLQAPRAGHEPERDGAGSLEALFRALLFRGRLVPQPDRRSGVDRRGGRTGGRRQSDSAAA
jgi:hypothetical protein